MSAASAPHSEQAQHPLDFRDDINGLRAVAIALVVCFHAFPGLAPGGFIGVDIFFVISGYLISRIVLKDLDAGRFEFMPFYGRRARRLLPALFLVLGSTAAFGWISLYSFEFESLGKHTLGALAFVSNLVAWNEVGYFDEAALRKPLIHLWSLGVEEQFYLFFPAVIWAATRCRFRALHVIAVGLLASFAANIAMAASDPGAAFFSPMTRIWEILIGSMLAAVQRERAHVCGSGSQSSMHTARPTSHRLARDGLSVIGASLIGVAAVEFDSSLIFPGWYALLPTCGTALLIAAGERAAINRLVLANRWIGALGLISYPLYLWHWPLLSLGAILQPDARPMTVNIVAVVAAIALSALTYLGVERPLASLRRSRSRVLLVGVPGVAIALLAGIAFSASGLPMRAASIAMPRDLRSDSTTARPPYRVNGCDLPRSDESLFAYCQHDSRGRARFAILGDSKAASLAPGLFFNTRADGFWMFMGGYKPGSTPIPVLTSAPEFGSSQASLHAALAAIAHDEQIRVVVLATATRSLFVFAEGDSIAPLAESQEYPVAYEGLDRAVGYLVDAGKKVVLLLDNPTFRDPVLCASRTTSVGWVNALLHLRAGQSSCQMSIDKQLALSARYRQLLDAVAARHPGAAKVFDTLQVLCDQSTGTCSGMAGDHHLYSYSDHISLFAAQEVAATLIPFVEQYANESCGAGCSRDQVERVVSSSCETDALTNLSAAAPPDVGAKAIPPTRARNVQSRYVLTPSTCFEGVMSDRP